MRRLSHTPVSCVIVAAALLALAMQQPPQRGKGDNRMADTFYSSSLDNPVAPAAPPIPIHPNGASNLPAESAVARPAPAVRVFVNDEMNSRLTINPASGNWRIAWASQLPGAFQPVALLADGSRIALQGKGSWALLGAGGKALAGGILGPGNIALDPPNRRMFLPSQESRVMARSLEDGKPLLILSGYFGQAFCREFIGPRDNGIVLVSLERMLKSKSSYKPDLSVIERYDFGSPMELGPKNVVKSASRTANLLRQTVELKAAMHGNSLAVAVPNAVYLADSDLRIQSEMTGEFTPLAMSLDEALNIYLLVETNDGAALWALTPKAELRFSFPLLPGEKTIGTPPIVRYDHGVYVLTSARILCLDPAGKLQWERSVANLAGAAVAPSGDLLVAAGQELGVWSRDGERRILYRFEAAGSLATAPLTIDSGDVIVASRTHCYRLTTAAGK